LRAEGEMVHCRLGEYCGRTLREVLFAYSTEIGADKVLLQAVLSLGALRGGLRDPLDERDSRRGNAVQKTAVFGGYLRVHNQLPFWRSRMNAAKKRAASPPVTQR